MAEIKFVLNSNTRRAIRHEAEIVHLFKCLVDSEDKALAKQGIVREEKDPNFSLSCIIRESAFIATANGLCVGLGCIRLDYASSIGSIVNVSVDPAHQGAGIGRALVVACINYIGSKGMEDVGLLVRKDNEAAIHLYKDLGFVPVSTEGFPDGMLGMLLELKGENSWSLTSEYLSSLASRVRLV
ncbi:MAG: GNAT family N-acetyltransferase [Shewanella sp.]